jgi:O-glycosyl hydrolase
MAQAGLSIGWIGIQNEPDGKSLTGVKLIGPECMGWEGTRELTKSQFETPEGIQSMDIIGTHDYWGAERDMDMNPMRVEMAALAKTHGKRIWQTEYSRVDCLPGCTDACFLPHVAQDPARIMTEADLNIRDGLEMVNYLYNDFSKANASAWLFWWTHNPNKGCGNSAQGQVGKHNSFNGLTILRDDQAFFFPKRFFTLSHYTRFIRPGSLRVKSLSDADAVVHPLAFVDPVKDQVIVVIYNSSASAWPLSIKLAGFEAYKSVKHYQTTPDADINVKLLETKVLEVGQDFSNQIPAQSISTLVFEKTDKVTNQVLRHKEGGIEGMGYLARTAEKGQFQTTNLKGETTTGKFRSVWNFIFFRNGTK